MKTTTEGPNGIKLVLDSSEIFPDDPGNGTPAMVWKGDFCATFWCAVGECELINHKTGEVKELTTRELEWLDDRELAVNNFIREYTNETTTRVKSRRVWPCCRGA